MKQLEFNVSLTSALIVLCGGASAIFVAMQLFVAINTHVSLILAVWFVTLFLASVCLGSSSVSKPNGRIASRLLESSSLVINCFAFGSAVSLLRGNPYLVDALPEVARAIMSVACFAEIGSLYVSWRKPVELECTTATLNQAAARHTKLRALGKQSCTHTTRSFKCSGIDALLGVEPMTLTSFRNYYLDQMEPMRDMFIPIKSKQDTPCKLEKALIREIEVRHNNLQAVYAELDEFGLGIILQNESGDSWVWVMPDVSVSGRFCYSTVRDTGRRSYFSSDSLDEVVLDAFKSGYTQVAPSDTLEKLSATREWKDWMQATAGPRGTPKWFLELQRPDSSV